MDVSVTIKDKNVRKLLERIQKRTRNLKPAMSLIGEIVQESIERNFETGGRPRRWKALSETTKEQRRRRNQWPGQTLIVHGKAGGLMGGINYRPASDRVTIGVKKAYAAIQHFGAKKGSFGTVQAKVKEHVRRLKSGETQRVRAHTRNTKIPWGDIPARPFMMVQDEDWNEIRESLWDYLLEVV